MKILFLTNLPSPYRVRFFNELARYCDLTVIYEMTRSRERDEKWVEQARDSYRVLFLRGIVTGADSAFSPGILRYLGKNRFDRIIICGVSTPTQILAISWCRLLGIPYCLEGDGAFPGLGKGFREGVKTFLMENASLCFSTCRMLDAYYRAYGVAPERIVRYPFTSVDESEVLPEPVSPAEKAALRRDLGMTETRIVLAVGQFIHRKGFDTLLEAARQLDDHTGIYLVGGEPTREYLQLRQNWNLDRVHFVGFLTRQELARYYRAADVFVLPTREDIWGLVVNEAMAYGLPVVTTTRCNAGLELIRSGENGFLVEPEDPAALAQALEAVFASEGEAMPRSALETIRGYTIEEMAKRHAALFQLDPEDL